MEDQAENIFDLGATKLNTARHCSAGAGWLWISEGYRLFKKNPGLWVLVLLMTIIVSMACKLIPVIGQVASVLISPVLIGGVMMIAHRCYMEFDAQFDDLFTGFRHRLWPLVQVGLLYIAGIFITVILAVLACMVLIGTEALKNLSDMINIAAQATPSAIDIDMALNLMLVLCIVLLMVLPVIMAYYFAPVLVMFHGVDAFAAMKLSFVACCKNAIPFLVYGLVVLLLSMLSVLTFFLGLLVLIPVLWASTYIAYRDIFLNAEQELSA